MGLRCGGSPSGANKGREALAQGLRAEGLDVRCASPGKDRGVGADAAWIALDVGDKVFDVTTGMGVESLTHKTVAVFTADIRSSPSARGRAGLSARSAQLAVGILKSAFVWAMNNGLLNRNPISGMQRPRVQQTEMRVWTQEQARAFLKFNAGQRTEAAWALLLTRGLRRGEACGLTWSKVDLTRGVLQIETTRVVLDGQVVESTPKTKAGRRTVPLDATLIGLLRSWRARQAEEKLAAGEVHLDSGYLLADELGRPYHPDTISNWFDVAVRAADLPRIRLHDTRHTAASLMLSSGVPTKVVSELLGHASPSITLSIYAHTLPSMAEDAGAALSESLLGAG